MNIKEIMDEILTGLTGDVDADLQYLRSQEDKYRTHENSQEIITAIYRVMYDILPEERKYQFNTFINKQKERIQQVITDAAKLVLKEEYEKAKEILETYIDEMDALPIYKDSDEDVYYCFQDYVEETIFKELKAVEQTIRRTELDFSTIYRLYGNVLLGLDRKEEARAAFVQGFEWNPMDMRVYFDFVDTFKEEFPDQYLNLSKQALEVCYKPEDIAHVYRNVATYYLEKEEYRTAYICLFFSVMFDKENKETIAKISFIQSKDKTAISKPDQKEVFSTFAKLSIPVAPDKKIVEILYAKAKEYESTDQKDGAIYFYTLLNKLLKDKKVQAKIDQLKGLDPEKLEEDDPIGYRVLLFKKSNTRDNFIELLLALGKGEVLLPVSKLTKERELLHKTGKEVAKKLHYLENRNKKKFLPVFSSKEQIPAKYENGFKIVSVPFIRCIQLVEGIKGVDSMVVNPFSDYPFEINNDLFETIKKAKDSQMN
ncbi:MAG: SseB family protein [Firmicutes bacterium]|nr:SseB family protein [Bacillota bacterium]